jgi:LmbE family N-acetylglucosaminyl deacetylase
MHWIYLSPHFDDVALSCGGLVWQQAQAGEQVSVWTICGGSPPAYSLSPFAESLHARWETGERASMQRRQEDLTSCAELLATPYHLPLLDCIYRRALEKDGGDFLYTCEEALFGALHPAEDYLVRELSASIAQKLPQPAELVCPLALGGHVDHRLARLAAEMMERPLWYYADYPYVRDNKIHLEKLIKNGWKRVNFNVSEEAMAAWERSVAAHASQISTFWTDLEVMRQALRAYWQQMRGVILWRPPKNRLV